MKYFRLLTLLMLMHQSSGLAQVGIGTTTPNPSAILDITSSSQGVLLPRLTHAELLAINSPTNGLIVYQTDNSPGLYVYNGSTWDIISTPNNMFLQNGNSFGTAAVLGTNDNQDLLFEINNTEQMRLNLTGLGIGTTSPQSDLHLNNTTPKIRLDYAASALYTDLYRTVWDALVINNESGNTLFAIENNGFVSVGHYYPQTILHVEADTPIFRLEHSTYGFTDFERTAWDALIIKDEFKGTLFTIENDGDIGIGTYYPNAVLHVDGSKSLSVAGHKAWDNTDHGTSALTGNMNVSILASDNIMAESFIATSDSRTKKKYKKFSSSQALSAINNLDIYTYQKYSDGSNGVTHIGVMAQQAKLHLPETVRIVAGSLVDHTLQPVQVKDKHVMDQQSMLYAAISAIQELTKQNKAQQNQINTLTQKLLQYEVSDIKASN